jgi:hypothetical protein
VNTWANVSRQHVAVTMMARNMNGIKWGKRDIFTFADTFLIKSDSKKHVKFI